MKINCINSYGTNNYTKIQSAQNHQHNFAKAEQIRNEVSFGSKATWKGLAGAVLGAIIAGPVGAAILGTMGAGYGGIEDQLDEDKKNGIDWDQMPPLG